MWIWYHHKQASQDGCPSGCCSAVVFFPVVAACSTPSWVPGRPRGHSPAGLSWVDKGVQRSLNFTWQELTTTLSLGLRLRVLMMPGTQQPLISRYLVWEA